MTKQEDELMYETKNKKTIMQRLTEHRWEISFDVKQMHQMWGGVRV